MSILHGVTARLTFWYVSVTTAFAVGFALAVYLLVSTALMQHTDAGLVQSGETFRRLLSQELEPDESARRDVNRVLASELPEIDLEDAQGVIGPEGRIVAEGADRTHHWMLPLLEKFPSTGKGPALRTAGTDEAPVRLYEQPFRIGARDYTLLLARSIEDQDELLEALRNGLVIGIPVWIAATAILGYWLLRRTLAPVGKMSAEASAIGAADLDRRLAVVNSRDEFGRLAETLNALLDRLRQAIEQQRRFMADASHELRTPVAVMRGEAEVTLRTGESEPSRLRDSLGVIAREAGAVSYMVEDLFLLARADAGQQVLTPSRFYLDELIESVVRSLRSLAAAREIVVESDLAPESMIVADESLLRRVLLNLLQNAVKYSARGGLVRVTLARIEGRYVVDVSDSGAGVGEEDRERIFERFYRGAASRMESGSGLGLSIARSIAELHGGSLAVASSTSVGATFRLVLPFHSGRSTNG